MLERLQKVKDYDCFGNPISLNSTKKSRTSKTALGGLLTILAVGLFTTIIIIVATDFLDTTKPVVSVNRLKMKAPPRLQLFDYEVLSSIGAIHLEFLNHEKLVRYLTVRYEFVTTTKGADGKNQETVETFPVVLTANLKNPAVKKLAIKAFLTSRITDKLDSYSYFGEAMVVPDLEPDDFWISGSKFNLPYRRLRIKIYPCSLHNPSDCVPVEALAETTLGNAAMAKVANYSNKHSPLGGHVDIDGFLYLGVGHTVLFTNFVKENVIYDDDSDLRNERLTHTYLDIDKFESGTRTRLSGSTHCTVAQIDGGLCEPYVEITWRGSFEKMIIQRRYKTLFQAASEIGGFCDLIFYGILLVYWSYTTRFYTRSIRAALVKGYIEMDQMRFGEQEEEKQEQKRRDHAEIQKLKTCLMDSGLKQISSQKLKQALHLILNTKTETFKLLQISFKSKVFTRVFIKHKILNTMTPALLFSKKKTEFADKKLQDSQKVEKNEKKTTQKKSLFEEQPVKKEKIKSKSEEENDKNDGREPIELKKEHKLEKENKLKKENKSKLAGSNDRQRINLKKIAVAEQQDEGKNHQNQKSFEQNSPLSPKPRQAQEEE